MNQDKKTNKFGHELRDLCICTNMKILNGRTVGDLIGQPTYIGPNGYSTVDYVITSEKAITGNKEIVRKFQVKDLNWLSDHRPLSLQLNSLTDISSPKNDSSILLKSEKRKNKLKYNPDFKEILNSTEVKINLQNITKQLLNLDNKNTFESTRSKIDNLFALILE